MPYDEHSPATPSERGFSLPETIVALVLMATAVFLLAEAGTAGWSGVRQGDDSARAIEQARSLLASVGHDRPLVAGKLDGRESDDTVWSIEIAPHPTTVPYPARMRLAAFKIDIEVARPGLLGRPGAQARLTTIKLGPRP